jgi:hypothetical protein
MDNSEIVAGVNVKHNNLRYDWSLLLIIYKTQQQGRSYQLPACCINANRTNSDGSNPQYAVQSPSRTLVDGFQPGQCTDIGIITHDQPPNLCIDVFLLFPRQLARSVCLYPYQFH